MKLIHEVAKVAATRLQQIAVITERSQLTYEDLLGMVHLIDMEMTTRGVRSGQTIVLDCTRGEFCIAFALYASARGIRIMFAPVSLAMMSGVPFDRVVRLQPSDKLPEDKQFILDSSWFTALGTIGLPDFQSYATPQARFLFHTSGSTGNPKFVESTESSRFEDLPATTHFIGVDMERRRFSATLSPAAGLAVSRNLGMLLHGGSVVSLENPSELILSYTDMYRIDAMTITPSVLMQFVRNPMAAQFLGSLRDVRIAGASVSPGLIAAFEEISEANIHIGFGSAETGRVFGHIHERGTAYEPGYVGTPDNKRFELAFFDKDGNLSLDASEGELGVKVKDLDTSRSDPGGKVVGGREDGFYLTGDIFRREDDRFFFVGRAKNTVNFSGNKISMDRITARLGELYPSASIAPLIVHNDDGLEQLLIVAEGLDETVSIKGLEAQLSEKFRGAQVARIQHVEKMPLTASGKVDTEELRKTYCD